MEAGVRLYRSDGPVREEADQIHKKVLAYL